MTSDFNRPGEFVDPDDDHAKLKGKFKQFLVCPGLPDEDIDWYFAAIVETEDGSVMAVDGLLLRFLDAGRPANPERKASSRIPPFRRRGDI